MKKDTKDLLLGVGVAALAIGGVLLATSPSKAAPAPTRSRSPSAPQPATYPDNPQYLHPKVGSILAAYADVVAGASIEAAKARIAKLLDDRWYRVEPVGEATIDAGAVKQVLRVTDVGIDAGLRAGYANREPGAGAWFFAG